MSASFLEDVSLVDKDFVAPLLDVVCSTLIICSTLCVRKTGCFGFSFKEAIGTCRLHDSFVILTTVPGNRVWKAVNCPQAEPKPGVHCLPSCYCVMPVYITTTWYGAKTHCANNGSYLAKADTWDRIDFIISILVTKGISNFWVGGYTETLSGIWQWLDGSPMDMGQLAIGFNGDCVNIWKPLRTLDDAKCTDPYYILCQKGTV